MLHTVTRSYLQTTHKRATVVDGVGLKAVVFVRIEFLHMFNRICFYSYTLIYSHICFVLSKGKLMTTCKKTNLIAYNAMFVEMP